MKRSSLIQSGQLNHPFARFRRLKRYESQDNRDRNATRETMGCGGPLGSRSAAPDRYGFMEHGFAKLARGPEAFATILHAIGVPAPHLMAWSTILIEVLGGLAVILGAFVTLVSIPMAVVLLVAIFTVHLPYGFSSIKLMAVTAAGAQFGPPGYETDVLYLACLAALVLGGSGPLAVDGLIRKRMNPSP